MGTAMGDKCEICGREEPSVAVKLWIKKHFRVRKMCVECIRTTRMLKTEGCGCDIELYTLGEPETNFMITENTIKDLYIKRGDKWQRQ